jgi:hypothetical protein
MNFSLSTSQALSLLESASKKPNPSIQEELSQIFQGLSLTVQEKETFWLWQWEGIQKDMLSVFSYEEFESWLKASNAIAGEAPLGMEGLQNILKELGRKDVIFEESEVALFSKKTLQPLSYFLIKHWMTSPDFYKALNENYQKTQYHPIVAALKVEGHQMLDIILKHDPYLHVNDFFASRSTPTTETPQEPPKRLGSFLRNNSQLTLLLGAGYDHTLSITSEPPLSFERHLCDTTRNTQIDGVRRSFTRSKYSLLEMVKKNTSIFHPEFVRFVQQGLEGEKEGLLSYQKFTGDWADFYTPFLVYLTQDETSLKEFPISTFWAEAETLPAEECLTLKAALCSVYMTNKDRIQSQFSYKTDEQEKFCRQLMSWLKDPQALEETICASISARARPNATLTLPKYFNATQQASYWRGHRLSAMQQAFSRTQLNSPAQIESAQEWFALMFKKILPFPDFSQCQKRDFFDLEACQKAVTREFNAKERAQIYGLYETIETSKATLKSQKIKDDEFLDHFIPLVALKDTENVPSAWMQKKLERFMQAHPQKPQLEQALLSLSFPRTTSAKRKTL